MQDAVPAGTGAMAAVMGVEPAKLEALCAEAAQGEVVSPANFNAPGPDRRSPATPAPSRARASSCAREKGKAIPLKVSAPFHCALMAPAARVVEHELAADHRRARSRFPIVANVDAQPNVDPVRVKELLVRQVDGAVRWEESGPLHGRARASTHALEIGPGKVLAGLVKRIAKDLRVLSVGDAASLDQVEAFLA